MRGVLCDGDWLARTNPQGDDCDAASDVMVRSNQCGSSRWAATCSLEQNNDLTQAGWITKDWFNKKNVDVLEGPRQSPDLNLVERLWVELKKYVHEWHSRDLDQLGEVCVVEWVSIP